MKTKTKRTCCRCNKLLPKKEMTFVEEVQKWICQPCSKEAHTDMLMKRAEFRIEAMGGISDRDLSDFGDSD